MDYRRDIDGLRTLAVVPVVLYHLRLPFGDSYLLPGGFLGVDVFFVLSGFLITRIILGEMAQPGGFSLKTFYIRRARRILPALFMVIFASVLAGVFLLTPSEMSRLLESALASVLFASNGYWFFELQGYGSPVGLLQPLLHTWSLAIEEQFYLIFPLMLLIIRPARWPVFAAGVMVVAIVVSLVLAERSTAWLPAFSFYSPISRAWEMLGGALLALAMVRVSAMAKPGRILGWWLPKLGVAVILVSMVVVDLDRVAHPGLVTVPVVLATLAVLWAAQGQEATTRLLSTAPFVAVGRLSYSLYLWHFPVFAFGRISAVEPLGPGNYLIWVALTAVLSVAGYYLVERPFRYRLRARSFMLCLSGSLIAVASLFLLGSRTDVLSAYRAQQLSVLYGGDFHDRGALSGQAWDRLNALAEQTEGEVEPGARRPSDDELQRLWFEDPAALNILLVGNSHSRDVFNTLDLVAREMPQIEVARHGMLGVFPDFQREVLYGTPNFAAADVIMIVSRYNENELEAPLNSFIAELQDAGKIVVIVGSTVEFERPSRWPLFDYAARGGRLVDGLDGLNDAAFDYQDPRIAPLNDRLRQVAQARGIPYLSRVDLICDASQETCTLRLPSGGRMLYDHNHLTMEGAAFVARRIVETEWLAPVFEAACAAGNEGACGR